MIEAVVFDIGNVFLHWQPEAFYDREIGEARRKKLFAEVPLNEMNLNVDRGWPFKETIYATAEQYPDWGDEICMWHDRWIEIAAPVFPRTVRLMEALQAKGVPVFSLTNFGKESYAFAATHYDFMNKFDRDFISGHLEVIKPDPRIYEILEEQSGLTGDALIFTDDRPENIAAAAARGWQTHLFENPEGWASRLVAEGLLTEEDAR